MPPAGSLISSIFDKLAHPGLDINPVNGWPKAL